MSLKKISIIIGTRPEAIKMAPVYLGLKDDQRFDVKLIETAQHRELLDQVLDVFQINAHIDLDIMQPMQGLPETSARIITQVSEALSKIKPDAVLVHGDTNTCLFSSLAAFYLKIPIGHVEAGLRTYNYNAPWPEEMNRRLTDPICQWCFAPTESAGNNLRKEGIQEDHIYVTGNTVIDALFYIRESISKQPPVIPDLPQDILDHHRLILVTGHRRESFGKPMREICRAFLEIVQTHPDTVLVYPVHLNPNVQKPVREILGQEKRIFLIEPIEYLSFVYLMEKSYIIITDSGGIQEEAPSMQKPVFVTRDVTERPEAVQAGCAQLVGRNRSTIVEQVSHVLNETSLYKTMTSCKNLYGDGQASQRIADILYETLK